MKTTLIKEVTSDWSCGYRVPNHTYIIKGDMRSNTCIGYIKESTGEKIMFSKPVNLFSHASYSKLF